MTDYRTMYYELAGKVADAIELLQEAMRQGETRYMLDAGSPAVEESDSKDESPAHS